MQTKNGAVVAVAILQHAFDVFPCMSSYVLCVHGCQKSTGAVIVLLKLGGGRGSSHERAQLPWTRLVTKVLEQLCKAVGQATTKASIMAVIGESCASLTPYGVDHSVAGDPYRP